MVNSIRSFLKGVTELISVKRSFRHIIVCLILALTLTATVVPVLRTEPATCWAKTKKKSSKKKKKTKKKTKKKKKAVQKEGFVKKNGNWYFLEKGRKKTGWFTVGDKKFYGFKKGSQKGQLAMGWQTIGKRDYFFRQEGRAGVICALCVNCVAKANGIACIFDEEGNIEKCKNAEKSDGSFVNEVGELARLNQAKNDILASLVVAQACVETGFGANIYCNNIFGIRAGSGWRKYKDYQEAIDDYVAFMHQYIPRIFGVHDWQSACWIIGRSGYAEAGNYGSALVSVVQSHKLTRFNK